MARGNKASSYRKQSKNSSYRGGSHASDSSSYKRGKKGGKSAKRDSMYE